MKSPCRPRIAGWDSSMATERCLVLEPRADRIYGAPTVTRGGSVGCQLGREELERGACLGLLFAGEVDPVLAEVDARFGRDLERFRRQAFGRELEDAVAVGVEPHLRDHLAREAARLPFELEHEDRPEHGEIVQLDPLGSVSPEQGPLLLGVELAQRTLAEYRLADRVGVGLALQPSRAHEPTGYRIDFDTEPAEVADVLADLIGIKRAQLDHRITHAPLDPARAHDDARPVERRANGSLGGHPRRLSTQPRADHRARMCLHRRPPGCRQLTTPPRSRAPGRWRSRARRG